MQLKTARQVSLIVNNVVKAFDDITALNKQGYNYLYLCSGFIAHFNLYGFIDHYSVYNTLKEDMVHFIHMNQWNNFSPRDQHYEYYMQKKEIYNAILTKAGVDIKAKNRRAA